MLSAAQLCLMDILNCLLTVSIKVNTARERRDSSRNREQYHVEFLELAVGRWRYEHRRPRLSKPRF